MAEGNKLQIPRVKLGNQGLEVKPNGIPYIYIYIFSRNFHFVYVQFTISLKTNLHNLIYFEILKLQVSIYTDSIFINHYFESQIMHIYYLLL